MPSIVFFILHAQDQLKFLQSNSTIITVKPNLIGENGDYPTFKNNPGLFIFQIL
jgi:hypothetical protein